MAHRYGCCMRLVKVQLSHFRRFRRAAANLESEVLAFVGPNEAGKSSVLQALASIEDDEPLGIGDLTDRRDVEDDTTIVEVRYLLTEEERTLVADVEGASEPRWFVLEKVCGGTVYRSTDPVVTRDLSARREFLESLRRVMKHTHYRRVLDAPLVVERGKKLPDDIRTLRERFDEHLDGLHVADTMLPRELRKDLHESLELFAERLDQVPDTSRDSARQTIERLTEILALEARNPHDALCELLESRRPQILQFTAAHRRFRNEYETDKVTDDNHALRNLLLVGGTDPDAVRRTMREGDAGRIRDLETRLNKVLKDAFDVSWLQSDVYPEFNIEQEQLTFHVNHPERGYTLVAEHSDGLKAFIALFAFSRVQSSDIPPVLLIDEAEQHLHYDAQADLVGMFYRQRAASQIIYTTHSAGCLPHDLGMGIRVVSPENGPNGETGYSRLSNRFWGKGAGTTPLLLAMGASALAYAPARRSLMVVGEGGTETILLPSLFAEAASERLDFQVLPGIANIAKEQVPDLDLEAPRIVYLVDGDQGGRENERTLKRGGVPARRILSLPAGHTTEDLVAKDVYLDAINEEFRRSGIDDRMQSDELLETGRVDAVQAWCVARGIAVPNKVAVAERIVHQRADRRLTTPAKARKLASLYGQVTNAMQVPDHGDGTRPGDD